LSYDRAPSNDIQRGYPFRCRSSQLEREESGSEKSNRTEIEVLGYRIPNRRSIGEVVYLSKKLYVRQCREMVQGILIFDSLA